MMTVRLKTPTIRFYAFDELDPAIHALLCKAWTVQKLAQAPYSDYFVGAAVSGPDGQISVGCNVERASWSQTTHAEQNAIDSMVAHLGPAKIRALAVVGAFAGIDIPYPPTPDRKAKPEPFAPCCGHCLQIIWENCCGDATTPIWSLAPNGLILNATLGDLLPLRFGPDLFGIRIDR
jgi:cytidine deaminase